MSGIVASPLKVLPPRDVDTKFTKRKTALKISILK
jgi:hypothetical protein